MDKNGLVNFAIDQTQVNSEQIEKMDKRLKKRKFKEGMNLNETLGFLVKEELIELMMFLGVYKSASMKKADMCSTIEKKIFENLEDVFGLMNYEHVSILNDPNSDYVSSFEIDNYLIENSLMFEYLEGENLGLFVPVDILEKVNALAEKNEKVL